MSIVGQAEASWDELGRAEGGDGEYEKTISETPCLLER